MKTIVTETLWVGFMTLLAAVMILAWSSVSDAEPHPVDFVQPVNMELKLARPLEPKRFYQAPKIQLSQQDFECLAKNIYYEAGIEDYAGKIAVAQITWNRVKTGRWGKTICRVVYARKQFSWTHQNKPAPRGPLWRDSRAAAEDFVNGVRAMGLQKSKYYHATWIKDPQWTRNLEVVAVIGQHRFYQTPQR